MATRTAISRTKGSSRTDVASVHQFRVTLLGTNPLVWRRIQVPEHYSFWDLHVAIQDAMGWQDCHLHEFRVSVRPRGELRIGIPDPEFPEEHACSAGWDVPVSEHVWREMPAIRYLYDFGDNWEHELIYEGLAARDASERCPRCVDGAAAGPPEDCGGLGGFEEFLRAIRNPKHPNHKEMRQWFGGPFNPEAFDPSVVTFDDPLRRWQKAFSE
jgi:hypothetical protein